MNRNCQQVLCLLSLSLFFCSHAAAVQKHTKSTAPKAGTAKAAASPAAASSAASSAATKAAARPLLMWKVSDGKAEVYLLGSIHMVPPSLYPLPKEMEAAFQKSKSLVLEVDESKQDPLKMQNLVAARGSYSGGDVIGNHLSKATEQALTDFVKTSGLPSAAFEHAKPWIVSMTIDVMSLKQVGFDPHSGIDHHFLEEALAASKGVKELESMEFQLDLLSGFSDDMQDKLLYCSLLDLKDVKKDSDDLIHAWKSGDENEMQKVLSKDETEHPELQPVMEKLLYDRNPTMTDKIESYIKAGEHDFVVVGAGHLVGPRGVIKLLQQRHYNVERITSAPSAGSIAK